MTSLYRPVLIESAEQAEALPIGTLAFSSEDYDDGTVMHWAAVKVSIEWARTDIANGLPFLGDAAMVDADIPWTALVPIEAEVERRPSWLHVGQVVEHQTPRGVAYGAEFDDRTGEPVAWEARLVTPWEEA